MRVTFVKIVAESTRTIVQAFLEGGNDVRIQVNGDSGLEIMKLIAAYGAADYDEATESLTIGNIRWKVEADELTGVRGSKVFYTVNTTEGVQELELNDLDQLNRWLGILQVHPTAQVQVLDAESKNYRWIMDNIALA